MWSASSAYSTHEPGSSSRSSRSRTVSLPSSRWRATRSAPPISSARSRRAFRSPTSGPQSCRSIGSSRGRLQDRPLAGHALELVAPALGELDARARRRGRARSTSRAPRPRRRAPATRAPMCTAMPAMSSPCSSTSPVCSPARTSTPSGRAAAAIACAHEIARAGPSNVARMSSPRVLTSRPRKRSSSRRTAARNVSSSSRHLRSPSSASRCGRFDDVDEQHRREHAVDLDRALGAVAGEELLDEIEHVVVAAVVAARRGTSPGQLDEARAGDVLRDVLPEPERQDRIAGAVDHAASARSTAGSALRTSISTLRGQRPPPPSSASPRCARSARRSRRRPRRRIAAPKNACSAAARAPDLGDARR